MTISHHAVFSHRDFDAGAGDALLEKFFLKAQRYVQKVTCKQEDPAFDFSFPARLNWPRCKFFLLSKIGEILMTLIALEVHVRNVS